MIRIEGDKPALYQWDLNRRIALTNIKAGVQVHFSHEKFTNEEYPGECPVLFSYEDEDGKVYANVPNIFLQKSGIITVYIYVQEDEKAYTEHHAEVLVLPRPKPSDYVYTETEIWTAEKAVADALEEAKASGDFKGEKGDKGDAGAIEFIVVTELPAIGDGSKIYLMPETDGEEPNRFGEYVFIEGACERIGSAGVEVNLNEYVKNTDFATSDGTKAGIVKLKGYGANGLKLDANGNLAIQTASINLMYARSPERPISPAELENAMWLGITGYRKTWNGKEDVFSYGNQKQLTDEEKGYAREWLGAVGATDYAKQDKAGVVKIGSSAGLSINPSTGLVGISSASDAQIGAKLTNHNPIVPAHLDYAVKTGITTNAIELTDEEKANACSWMGAVKEQHPEFSDGGATRGYVYFINASGEQTLAPAQIQAVKAGSIPYRDGSFNFYVGTPGLPYHCANKGYVDNLITGLTERIAELEAKLNI